MQIVSNKYKEYLNNSLSISPKSKIVVDNIEYLGDVIKTSPKFSHSNSTFIGGFPAKTVSFDIYNFSNDLDFENKEIKIYKGIVIDGITEWVMQGIFIAQSKDITNNISTKIMSISKAQDKTQLFDSKYESKLNWENNQTHTGLEIVQEICTKLGVTLETTDFSWANYSFKQPNFVEDITYREVISRIAQIGGEISFINNNGKLVIKKQTLTGDKIQRKRYKSLSKEKCHTINTVVLGKEGMNDDIKYPDTISDRIEFKINDNPFVDLYRKEMISTVAEYIIGKSYTPFILEDFVDGFIYELNDAVTIIDKNGEEFDAVILDYSSSSRIKSNIKAETPDKNNTDYKLAGSAKEEIRKVKLDVDHINQKIEAIASEVDTNEEKIASLEITTDNISTKVSSVEKDLFTTNTNLSNLSDEVDTLSDNIDGVSADFEDFKDNEYIQSIDNLQKQIDGAIQFWNGAEIPTINNYPANEWTTENDRINHQADIYTVIEDIDGEMKQGKSYRFDKVNGVWQWIELTDNELSAVQAIAQEALDKAKANANEIGTVKTRVSSLEQTDEQIKASVESIDKQIIPTSQTSGSDIHVEDSADAPLISLEIEGKSEQNGTPTPDTPVEIESLGYENLFDVNGTHTSTSVTTTITENILSQRNTGTYCRSSWLIDNLIIGQKYILRCSYSNPNSCSMQIRILDSENTNNIAQTTATTKESGDMTLTFTATETSHYIRFYSNTTSTSNTYTVEYSNIQLEKGSVAHSCIPYGKYGIEVETVGKNKLKISGETKIINGVTFTQNEDGSISAVGTATANTTYTSTTLQKIKPSTRYKLSGCPSGGSTSTYRQLLRVRSDLTTNIETISEAGDGTSGNLTTTDTAIYALGEIIIYSGQTVNLTFYPQLEEGIEATDYEPYKSNTTLFVLNEPLRSLPNEVKDIAYIKNNKLYVDRYIRSVIYDGSPDENITFRNTGDDSTTWAFNLNDLTNINVLGSFQKSIMSDRFSYNQTSTNGNEGVGISSSNDAAYIAILRSRLSANTTDALKSFFSENNTEFLVGLMEPYTEEIGEIEMPSTFKNVTNISITDELEPTLNIEYVRDTTLSNYVEGQINKVMTIEERHYSDLVIEDNNIKASVTEINSNLSNMSENINTVQETLTSTEKTIEVISTNIDTTTGEVRKVTTLNGFTFDSNGLKIYTDANSYNTQIDNKGTYYKDGEEVISQTTKDGFLANNIKQKGQHMYSYDDINEIYEYVEERIEVDGEHCYATFYNGEE